MINQKKTGLGRGLKALLDDSDLPENIKHQASNDNTSLGSISFVRINQVEVNPFQPRTEFDAESLKKLSDSIKLQGLIQPITVRQAGQNSYQLISGERRLRASKLAGLTEIPAYIRTANDQQMLEMALIENIQRENLNAIEVALSFQRMIDECNLKQEELGDRVSKNRSTVTNYLRLLKLPPVIQASIRDKKISMGHARALISVEDSDKQIYIYQEIIKNGLSVRKVEELVRQIYPSQIHTIGKDKKKSKGRAISFQYMKIQDDLASKFSTHVKLKLGDKGKGSIEINFMSDDDLARILEMLDW
jgi:ParB family transcriptional regulator, chromosome partitioning protein|uniref:ParB/RepB/Spo0J family partition protein n=1 Tax=Daejeonella sp. TaxID=2805397 RepID=UPI00404B98ED